MCVNQDAKWTLFICLNEDVLTFDRTFDDHKKLVSCEDQIKIGACVRNNVF